MLNVAKLTFVKLDARHAAHDCFKYRVEITGGVDERVRKYIELRNWCWEMWGPGRERDYAMFGQCPQWAWHTPNDRLATLFIYLLSDEEASFFKLKWF